MPGLMRAWWRVLLTLTVIGLVVAGPMVAQNGDPAELAREAAAAYDMGDFEAAVTLFEAAIEAGGAHPVLYFNLGNAYYEAGQLGPAMLSYRRAALLAPRDADVRANLALVRALRVDFQGDEASIIDRLATLSANSLTQVEQSILTLMLWTLWYGAAAVWALGWLPRRREISIVLVGGALILALAVSLLLARLYTDAERPPAVVLANVASVTSGPGTEYLEIYRLHAAAEMRLLEFTDGWARFVLPDGRQGWIALDSIERVQG